ncbi:MAG: GNAT family N-acetyltransferase [Schleiferiaceae bacterium]
MASTISWQFAPFSVMSAAQLHGLLALRADVFVVEQNCPYLDPDSKDRVSHHLWAEDSSGTVVAVARVVPPGVSYPEPSIGRVATALSERGTGLGRELMRRAIAHAEALYPGHDLVISAQAYLLRFYRELGFRPEGAEYDEDGIPHIQMRKSST